MRHLGEAVEHIHGGSEIEFAEGVGPHMKEPPTEATSEIHRLPVTQPC
jgi:hypothetical protein